jgi:hypothetical protein
MATPSEQEPSDVTRKSDLLFRVTSFLPQIHAANQKIDMQLKELPSLISKEISQSEKNDTTGATYPVEQMDRSLRRRRCRHAADVGFDSIPEVLSDIDSDNDDDTDTSSSSSSIGETVDHFDPKEGASERPLKKRMKCDQLHPTVVLDLHFNQDTDHPLFQLLCEKEENEEIGPIGAVTTTEPNDIVNEACLPATPPIWDLGRSGTKPPGSSRTPIISEVDNEKQYKMD